MHCSRQTRILVWELLPLSVTSRVAWKLKLFHISIDKEQMPAPKSLVLTFASLCLEKSLHVFALTVSRLSTILMTERFRVNARTVLMNSLTELVPSKMELAVLTNSPVPMVNVFPIIGNAMEITIVGINPMRAI
jgi:hypothetical protein